MNKIDTQKPVQGEDRATASEAWQQGYQAQGRTDKTIRNRSGLDIQPLYWPAPGSDPD